MIIQCPTEKKFSPNSSASLFITANVCIRRGKQKICFEGNREGRMCLTDAAFFVCSVFTISKVSGSGTQPSREKSCTHAGGLLCIFFNNAQTKTHSCWLRISNVWCVYGRALHILCYQIVELDFSLPKALHLPRLSVLLWLGWCLNALQNVRHCAQCLNWTHCCTKWREILINILSYFLL